MVALLPVCCLRSRRSGCGGRHASALLLLPLVLAQILYAIAVPDQVNVNVAAPHVLGVREQCGGLLWSGTLSTGSPMDAPYPQVKCGEGLKCHRDSKWYYECVPEVDAAWQLEKALHANSDAEEIPTVQIEAHAESDGNPKVAPEHSSDVVDDVEEKVEESVIGHYLKEGAEVIKSVFNHDESKGSEEGYSLARTLASWAHRRQMKAANLSELVGAVGIDQYGQCGGIINAPEGQSKDGVWDDVDCWKGWECTRVNQWYYQCQPIKGYIRPATVVEVDGAKKEVLDVWAQCGGKGGQVPDNETPVDAVYPSYICFPNTSCKRQNEWYWQCLPDPGFNFGGPGGNPTPGGSPNPVSPNPVSPNPGSPNPGSPDPIAESSPPLYYSPFIPQEGVYSPSVSPPTYPGNFEDGYYSPPLSP